MIRFGQVKFVEIIVHKDWSVVLKLDGLERLSINEALLGLVIRDYRQDAKETTQDKSSRNEGSHLIQEIPSGIWYG